MKKKFCVGDYVMVVSGGGVRNLVRSHIGDTGTVTNIYIDLRHSVYSYEVTFQYPIDENNVGRFYDYELQLVIPGFSSKPLHDFSLPDDYDSQVTILFSGCDSNVKPV